MMVLSTALRSAVGGALLLALASLGLCLAASPGSAGPRFEAGGNPDETLVFGPMKVSRWLAETVVRAADVTGVDPAYLMALADKESSLLPANKAQTSSAEGLFQFVDGTWLEVIRRYAGKHGFSGAAQAVQVVRGQAVVADQAEKAWILNLRRDPYLSALMAGEMINTHREILAGQAQRDPSFSELYMAHFLGVHGASRFLELLEQKPTATAARAFPKAAKANRAIFVKSDGPKKKPVTLTDVRDRLEEMIVGRVARYEAVRGGLADVASN